VNPIIIRRFIYFAAFLLVIFTSFIGYNLVRFSPENWLQDKISKEIMAGFAGDVEVSKAGTHLVWTNIDITWQGYHFAANEMSLSFNPVSVMIGKPQAKAINLISPYLEIPAGSISVQQLRLPMGLDVQNLTLSGGLFVSGINEFQDIELSMSKNGVFGEYAVQFSGNLETDALSINLGYSALIGIDGQDNLVLGKSQIDSTLSLQNGSGRLDGKIKSLIIDPNNNAIVKFISWSSSWKTSADILPYTLDWAGGLSQGELKGDTFNMGTFDSAIAYIDEQQMRHTFAIQSNDAMIENKQLVGQLGLSLLTEYPIESPWQSYNLVMTGNINPGDSILQWNDADMQLAMIDNSSVKETHIIKARSASIDRTQSTWTFNDGDWFKTQDKIPAGDFGFGAITGHWPSLQITDAPTIANKLQIPFNLIATDVEYLDALFDHLVP